MNSHRVTEEMITRITNLCPAKFLHSDNKLSVISYTASDLRSCSHMEKSTRCCQSCSRQWPMIFVNFDNAELSQCSDMYVCKVIQGPGDVTEKENNMDWGPWPEWSKALEDEVRDSRKKTFQLEVEL